MGSKFRVYPIFRLPKLKKKKQSKALWSFFRYKSSFKFQNLCMHSFIKARNLNSFVRLSSRLSAKNIVHQIPEFEKYKISSNIVQKAYYSYTLNFLRKQARPILFFSFFFNKYKFNQYKSR